MLEIIGLVVSVGAIVGFARGRGVSPVAAGSIAVAGYLVIVLVGKSLTPPGDARLAVALAAWAWVGAVALFVRFVVAARRPTPGGTWLCATCHYTNGAHAVICEACQEPWAPGHAAAASVNRSIPRSLRIRAVVFVILGAGGLVVGAWPVICPPGFGVLFAWACFFLAGTALSSTSQAALALRSVTGKTVRVEIHGLPLPGPGEPLFEVASVAALGAGLRLYLRPASGGPQRLLKVAQPGPASVREDRVEIRGAAYVSWAGTRLGPGSGDGAPTVALVVVAAGAPSRA